MWPEHVLILVRFIQYLVGALEGSSLNSFRMNCSGFCASSVNIVCDVWSITTKKIIWTFLSTLKNKQKSRLVYNALIMVLFSALIVILLVLYMPDCCHVCIMWELLCLSALKSKKNGYRLFYTIVSDAAILFTHCLCLVATF